MAETAHKPAVSFAPSASGVVHRWTNTLIPTTREAPAEATTPSHRLLLRGGFIRQIAAGVYDYLPLAKRVLTKIERIIREELDAAGCSELLLPAFVPIELYKGTKRDVDYGDLLFKLEDRHGRATALGPTHEETVTELAKAGITSYKQLPLTLYQIQTKFRDEFRPRAGLLRGREFIMKDAYSFHLTVEGAGGLNETYDRLYQAYVNIFKRCALRFTVVEAEAGPIGGSASHEFMVDAPTGEDTVLICPESGYAANVEKCEIGERTWSFASESGPDLTPHHTPGMPGIDAVAGHLGVEPSGMLKTIVFEPAEGEEASFDWILAVVRGDHEVNEGKVRDAAGCAIALADEKKAKQAGFAIGYVSPRVAQHHKSLVLIDQDATTEPEAGWATGDDRPDHHVTGFRWTRDLGLDAATPDDSKLGTGSVKLADIRNAVEGDPSPRAAGATLEARRGIEVGHIFKLGTKYSDAFGFAIMNETQKQQPVIMGCYGIGVSRTVASCVEQSHDDSGIIWPTPVAPYHVIITMLDPGTQEHEQICQQIAGDLAARGIDVLIDDRKERPGVKFKDADLIGIPLRLTIGAKALEKGGVEFKPRTEEGKGEIVPADQVVDRAVAALTA